MGCEIDENDGLRDLKIAGARKARQHADISAAATALDIGFYGSLVAGAYALLLYTAFHPLACLIAFIMIAKAQNSLLLVGHEAIHRLLFVNRRLNDAIGAYFCFGPMGVNFYRSRAAHLDHHRFLLTDRDEKLDQQLEAPTRHSYVSHLIKPLFGSYLLKGVLRLVGKAPDRRAKPQYVVDPAQERAGTLSIVVSSLTLFTISALLDWRLYPLFWLLPLFTLTAFFHNGKGFLDHARLPGEEADLLYTYQPGVIDRVFFGTLQALHAEHHMYPYVPYRRLKELHSDVSRLPHVRCRKGYCAFLVEYFRRVKDFGCDR